MQNNKWWIIGDKLPANTLISYTITLFYRDKYVEWEVQETNTFCFKTERSGRVNSAQFKSIFKVPLALLDESPHGVQISFRWRNSHFNNLSFGIVSWPWTKRIRWHGYTLQLAISSPLPPIHQSIERCASPILISREIDAASFGNPPLCCLQYTKHTLSRELANATSTVRLHLSLYSLIWDFFGILR